MSRPTDAPVTADQLAESQGAKKKRKISRVRLPTPPPDPTITRKTSRSDKDSDGGSTRKSSRNEKESEFFDYLESLPQHGSILSRSTSMFAPAIAAEDAFDHLEKLYKLMEQMLQLREQNARLHRRVRDLEHLRNLQDMHRMVDEQQNNLEEVPTAFDQDSMYAENLLENILKKSSKQSRFRQTILRKSQRYYRSSSMAFDKDVEHVDKVLTTGCTSDKKVSKWTKVKAAFKWEKASSTVSDAKSQDSGLSGMIPVNYEVARYLRVPSTSDDVGISPGDSGAAEASTPGTISSASSTEDIHRHVRRKNIGYTSDEDQIFAFDSVSINRDDPKPSTSKCQPHRTPWAKMKGIINTRSSIKKQHRLSARSDEFRIDGSICSENEDVFDSEDSPRSPVLIVQTPEEVLHESLASSNAHDIPMDIIGRYHQVLAEDEMKELHDRHISKWDKVKKAFLSSPNISRIESTSPSPPSKKDINTSDNGLKLHDEIQRNYLQLQQKLSVEFQDKLREWERSKQGSACSNSTSNPGTSNEECKDPAFKKKMEEWEKMKGLSSKPNTPTSPTPQLTSEQNLPPEFRKKLEEWKRIKKISRDETSTQNTSAAKKKLGEWPKWRSISGRTEPETPQYSDDFMRKLEEWKQMKAANIDDDASKLNKGNRTPSPLIGRKESSIKEHKRIRDQTEKELQWFEKELGKIDREKQRLERERQKFLDSDERITKLRKSIAGNTVKKDILVHTPSGYYRFEGISRKFTQKLYEWEKAQGIGPESSTFALLRSSNIPHIRSPIKGNESRPSLVRSKSADSVINSEMNPPVLSPQPSSLSLNDVDNLEKEVMLDHVEESMPDILDNADEPEALIVEVEDIVEETAAPLQSFLEKHTPVYQRQDNNRCEGKTKAAPNVRRSESTKAQANYNLIEEIVSLIKSMTDRQMEIESASFITDSKSSNKNKPDIQMRSADTLLEKVISLQEANSIVTLDFVQEDANYKSITDVLETINDLTSKSCHLANKLNIDIRNMLHGIPNVVRAKNIQSSVTDNLKFLNKLILDIRRKLSYICAASDMTAPSRKKRSIRRQSLKRTVSYEKERYLLSKSKSREDTVDAPKSTDTETSSKTDKSSPKPEVTLKSEQGAVKKRLKYRQKNHNSRTLEDSDEDDDKEILLEQRKNKPRRGIRSQNSSDSNKSSSDRVHKEPKCEEKPLTVDPKLVEKVVVPTETSFVNVDNPYQPSTIPEESPVTIFVKTTRKLFTPIIGELHEEKPMIPKFITPPDTPIPTRKKLFRSKTDELAPKFDNVTHLPPLPASPTPQRKAPKEISPNIRMMLVRYNQKLTEDSANTNKSGGSSGSASPVAWRSPVLERRVKAQTEKYQMEIQKLSPLLGARREVQKSASVGVMYTGSKQVTVHEKFKPADNTKGILKSSSISVIRSDKTTKPEPVIEIPEPIEYSIPSCSTAPSTSTRSGKLQKAKEEFFKAPVVSERTTSIPHRNRLSQISVGSDTSDSSSYNLLVKSASAGMINIDPTTYKQFEPELHSDGYVSLPRSSKGLLSNITSKFRKVKMRRGKEHHAQQTTRMNTISQLCRQSLLVDINTNIVGGNSGGSQETLPLPESNRSSGQSSPANSRTGSWIRKPKLFKSNK